MKYKTMKVFNWLDMPREVHDEVCDEQPNDSYRCVWLDGEYLPKTVEWLLANGAEKKDERVLVSISW